MGITKSEFFSTEQNQLAEVFKALGHPARIAIIEYILKSNSCICNDLVDVLPLSQATISQHLKELKTAGIIKGSIEGKSVCYCIDETTIEKVKAILEVYIEKSCSNNSSCC